MKEKYYYLRTKRGKVPVGTVYVVQEGVEKARGVSILSFRDALNLREGRRHARNYALRAFYTKKSDLEIKRGDALDMLEVVNPPFFKGKKKLFKAQYNPALTNHEKKLLSE